MKLMAARIRTLSMALILVFASSLFAYAQLMPEVTVKPKPKKPPAAKVTPKPAEKAVAKPEQPQKPPEPEPTQIVVETSANAEVYLDDQFAGRASSEGRLVIGNPRPGERALRVSLAGKRYHETKVTVVAGQLTTVQAALEDLAPSEEGGIYNVGGDVRPPIPIYNPNPQYTKEAKAKKIQGNVVLLIVVDAEGNVTDARVVSQPLGMGLDESAVRTVRTWKFKPAARKGTPVPVRVMVEVSFKLS